MKRIAMIALLLALCTFIGAKQSPNTDLSPAVINSSVGYLDKVLVDVTAKLQTIADSPYARSGSWLAIKAEFKKCSQTLPGDYFWVTPDGHYYSLERDFSNLNLSDRGYFEPLFQGNTVRGFPVYSRASGKKGAVIVVPVLKDGKVTSVLSSIDCRIKPFQFDS